MSNPTWPTTLPCPADAAGDYAPLLDNIIKTSMETGAPKRRRRFTAVPETFTATVILDSAQMVTLDAFVVDTLQDVMPFDWLDWRTGLTATYVFQKRPTYSRIQSSRSGVNPNGLWTASLELLKVP